MNNTLDKFNLRQIILEAVDQIQHKYTIENIPSSIDSKFDSIIINGMGGSALPAELLLASFFQLSPENSLLPIYIHRSYGASRRISPNSLVISISYSGNTEETLSAYTESLDKGNTVIAVAAAGALIEKAQQLGKPYVIIPNPDPMFQPRYATLYILKAILEILIQYGLMDAEVSNRLISYLDNVNPEQFEQKGQELAEKLKGKTPVIYGTNEYKIVPHFWKIKINENAKTPCFWNYFPELNHNEMVGFTNPQANFQFVLIHNASEKSRNITRIAKLQQLFESRGLSVIRLEVEDYGNYLANTIAMILIGDWTAYYLALAYGIDPTPVDMVEEFKLLMKD